MAVVLTQNISRHSQRQVPILEAAALDNIASHQQHLIRGTPCNSVEYKANNNASHLILLT